MEAFALYLFKSVVWLTGFALVYLLFLRNERYFLMNRIYLVAGVMASIIFPFFTWHYTIVIPIAPSVEVSDIQMMGVVNTPETFPIRTLLFYTYLAGALYLLYRIIRQTIHVIRVIRKSEILPYRSAKLIRTDQYPASFSFFSFVFVNPSSSDTETNEIVNHELEHVRQRHWIDLLLFELLCTLQWLNPVCWLYGRFIRQNHEYLADQHALQRTPNPAIYRAALINQLFGGEVISLANSFNYSINKKRFYMMKNTINPPIRKLKLLMILPIIAGVFYAFATPEYRYAQGEDQNPTYSITQDKIQIPFTNELTKADLEAIKSDLAKVGMTADYTSLEFTKEGNLKGISAKVSTGTGSVSFNSQEVTANSYPIFKKEPTGEFGVYFSGVVNGTVVKPGGSPLSGASVVIAGTNVGTMTNQNGEFQLRDVPKDVEIVISYVGYESMKVKSDEVQPMAITMNPVNVDINEVTVTALDSHTDQPELEFKNVMILVNGVEIPKSAVENLDPDIIKSVNVITGESASEKYGEKGNNGVVEITLKEETFSEKIISRKESLGITKISGYSKDPNDELILNPNTQIKQIKFKGENVFKKEPEPLILLDGVITENYKLENINPDTFESINVLKGEKAISKYGNKGINGAVEIITKKGQPDLSNQKKETSKNVVFTQVEQMPEFPRGDVALRNFIASSVKYPAEASKKGIQGKIYVTFVVDKSGKVTDAKIARGVDPSLDKEGIRVVQSMPLWKPGTQGGKAVDVQYTIPINFVLEKETKKSETTNKEENPVFFIVEEMPEFPGGDEALRNFIASNVKYPAEASKKGIQGKVYVNFIVTKTGSISDAKIARGVDALLDQEALRVVNSLPKWTPGKQKGVNVNVSYTVPINFVLQKDTKKSETTNKQEGEVFFIVEEMPEFPGGDEALRNFIASNVKYPVASKKGIEGKVYINFVVTKTGSITNAKVVRGVDASLDQEALRVINLLPKWIPGKQKGVNVDVSYTVPINFVLSKDTPILTLVEQLPSFPGGEEALKSFIAANKKYPEIVLDNGIVGMVVVKFIIDENGNITNVRIARGVDPSLDKEAMRIVKSMPKWIPAIQNGKNVAVENELSINFPKTDQYRPHVVGPLKQMTQRTKAEAKPSVNQTAPTPELIIVPNPTKDKAVITLKDSNYNSKLEVSVYDKDGKLIKNESKTGPTFTLSFGNLASGNYFIVAKAGTIQFSGQLVVNH